MRARILNASAGSGKTYQLAYKYVRDVVEQPTLYRHILAVTFTNKATEEMKSRILSEIHTLASGGKSGYLASLCAELSLDERTVRTRAREARTRILHDYFSSPHRLISTGGTLRKNSCALVGHIAQGTLRHYNVDLAFISCKGLSKERGIMESNEDESVLKECMASQADRTILLADHTKFSQTAFVHSFDFDRIQTIVTDEPVSSGWRTLLEKKHIDLLD